MHNVLLKSVCTTKIFSILKLSDGKTDTRTHPGEFSRVEIEEPK